MRKLLAALAVACLSGLMGLPAAAQTGTLTLTPSSGPVGTVVTLQGSGCNNPGQPANFMFGNQGERTGTVGGVDFTIPVDATGHFHGTFRIPATMQGYQGQGGGSVAPGGYAFYSLPPYCITAFTVTPGNLAAGGIGPAPVAGAGLLIAGLVIWLTARRRYRSLSLVSIAAWAAAKRATGTR